MRDWKVLRVWGMIALVAAAVAAVHMAFVMSWADRRMKKIWEAGQSFQRQADGTELELEVTKARVRKLEETLFGEEGAMP